MAENCIRVLYLDGLDGRNILQCTLSSILLDDDVDCDAISYAWKNETPNASHPSQRPATAFPAWGSARTAVAGRPCSVSPDAVCTKQSADDQRVVQVQMIDTIYSTANTVIVWLSSSRNDSNIMEVGPRFG